MQPGSAEYERMKELMPDVFGGKNRIRAKFTIQPEPDPVATEATGKAAPQIISSELMPDASGRFNVGLMIESAPIVENSGFTVYRDVIYVEEHIINSEGHEEKDFQSCRALPKHKAMYPKEWAAFETESLSKETPLLALKGITPAVITTLTEIGVRNVEQLVACERELPEFLAEHRRNGKKLLDFFTGKKPRLRLIDGELTEVEAA
jgi:hypothetical protein